MTPHERARDIVDTHFPNYARQCVPTSVTDLERAITAALKEQATLLDRSVEQTLGLNTKVLALERTLAAKEASIAQLQAMVKELENNGG